MKLTKEQNDWLIEHLLRDFVSYSPLDTKIIKSLVDDLDLDVGVWDREYRYLVPPAQWD